MDFFGIGAALKGCFETYLRASRYKGRSTSLYDSLKDGDRVVCVSHQDAKEVERQAKVRNVDVTTIVLTPHCFDINGIGTSQGRTILDHRFVEEFHLVSIEQSIKHLDEIESRLSGYDHRHIETKMKAMEMAKWRL